MSSYPTNNDIKFDHYHLIKNQLLMPLHKKDAYFSPQLWGNSLTLYLMSQMVMPSMVIPNQLFHYLTSPYICSLEYYLD